MPDKGDTKPEIDIRFDLDEFQEVYNKFYKDTKNFVLRCKKPDRKQFMDMVRATSMGFFFIGFTGCFVKLVCIPVNKFLLS